MPVTLSSSSLLGRSIICITYQAHHFNIEMPKKISVDSSSVWMTLHQSHYSHSRQILLYYPARTQSNRTVHSCPSSFTTSPLVLVLTLFQICPFYIWPFFVFLKLCHFFICTNENALHTGTSARTIVHTAQLVLSGKFQVTKLSLPQLSGGKKGESIRELSTRPMIGQRQVKSLPRWTCQGWQHPMLFILQRWLWSWKVKYFPTFSPYIRFRNFSDYLLMFDLF